MPRTPMELLFRIAEYSARYGRRRLILRPSLSATLYPDAAPLVCENRCDPVGAYSGLCAACAAVPQLGGSPPSCPAVPCIRPLHIFSFLPSTSGDAIRRLQRLLGLVRSCPALLQLRISLPPLDEAGRDGLGPRGAAVPHSSSCASPFLPSTRWDAMD
ncbi:hypothetical protein B0H13DRAFT_2437658 [Mycena leptocephala]|nr:hypothetical protein B0H13DRAFT_2437658 [Mycena leptocephala]